MAGERRLYLGSDATDARYLIKDPGPNGDLVVTDLDDGNREVFRYDSVGQLLEVLDLEIESIVGASGTTVYDDSTKTVGDGTTSANHESVNTDKAIIGSYADIGSVPTGEPAGFIAVTETGHLVVEDGQ